MFRRRRVTTVLACALLAATLFPGRRRRPPAHLHRERHRAHPVEPDRPDDDLPAGRHDSDPRGPGAARAGLDGDVRRGAGHPSQPRTQPVGLTVGCSSGRRARRPGLLLPRLPRCARHRAGRHPGGTPRGPLARLGCGHRGGRGRGPARVPRGRRLGSPRSRSRGPRRSGSGGPPRQERCSPRPGSDSSTCSSSTRPGGSTRAAPTGSPAADYALDVAEVQLMGALNSTTRTAAETATALFFNFNVPIQMNSAMRGAATGSTILEAARLFGLTNTSAADAIITCWREKFDQPFWRPVTAIHEAADDGNPRTYPDPTWAPARRQPALPGLDERARLPDGRLHPVAPAASTGPTPSTWCSPRWSTAPASRATTPARRRSSRTRSTRGSGWASTSAFHGGWRVRRREGGHVVYDRFSPRW